MKQRTLERWAPLMLTAALLLLWQLIVVAFEYARGQLVDFASWRWIEDEPFARAWGRWTGRFHAAARAYAEEHPERVARARRWDELHDGVLRGVVVDPRDDALAADPASPPLAAGEIISTGTLTRALPVRPGETWSTKLTGLPLHGIRLALA